MRAKIKNVLLENQEDLSLAYIPFLLLFVRCSVFRGGVKRGEREKVEGRVCVSFYYFFSSLSFFT